MDDNAWKRLCASLGVTRDGVPAVCGVDLGSPEGDYSAAQCPHCGEVSRWREAAPQRCKGCHRQHNFAGLYVVR